MTHRNYKGQFISNKYYNQKGAIVAMGIWVMAIVLILAGAGVAYSSQGEEIIVKQTPITETEQYFADLNTKVMNAVTAAVDAEEKMLAATQALDVKNKELMECALMDGCIQMYDIILQKERTLSDEELNEIHGEVE